MLDDLQGSARQQHMSRDREIVSLKRKIELLSCQVRDHNLAKNKEIENTERFMSMKNSYISNMQPALSIVEKLREPYEVIQEIIENLKKEVGQLSRAKLNELRRMTKPPVLIKRTLELVTHLLRIEKQSFSCTYIDPKNDQEPLAPSILPSLSWERDCLALLSHRNFLSDISSYKPYQLSSKPSLMEVLRREYLCSLKDSKDGISGVKSSSVTLPRITTKTIGKDLGSGSLMPKLPSFSITNTKRRSSESLYRTTKPANLTLEKVAYSSKTCASLLKWCIDQIEYSRVLQTHDHSVIQTVDEAKSQIRNIEQKIVDNDVQLSKSRERLVKIENDVNCITHEIDILKNMLEQFQNQKGRENAVDSETTETPRFQIKQLSSTSETDNVPKKTTSYAIESGRKVPAEQSLSEHVAISKILVTVTQKLAFEEGSSKLTKVALKSLNGVLSVLNDCESKICIEASQSHSEASGINHARASAVKNYLTSKGINPARLRTHEFTIESEVGSEVSRRSGRSVRKSNDHVKFYIIQELRLAGTIEFSQMSSSLKPSSTNLLNEVIQIMDKNPFMHLKVEGHTDNRPSWGQSNLELSTERATAVCKYVINVGSIVHSRLLGVGCGDLLPIESNATSDGRQANRRVEFHLEDHKAHASMRELLQASSSTSAIAKNNDAICSLVAIASGKFGMGMRVRRCAADVLISIGVDWDKLRLLYVAGLKESSDRCAMATLNIDLIRIISRWYFHLCKDEKQ